MKKNLLIKADSEMAPLKTIKSLIEKARETVVTKVNAKLVLHLVLFIFCFLLAACEHEQDKNGWAQETATVIVESLGEGNYGYTIQYDVPQSTAVNVEHKPIKGPISQHGISDKKPINGQKLKMRYRRDEPIIFELLDPIQYEK